MATNPIYVETEEEIPEVVERLRRLPSDDTMLVLPMRSRIGQSRFNFQLLRNYAARMGKRVTVVCDDPAVQKMASETGFAVFGAIGAQGEGIPSEPEAPPPPRRWWQPRAAAQATHVGVVAPRKLLSVTATEIRPVRFFAYIVAASILLIGLGGAAVFVPSATVTLEAQAQPFQQTGIQVQAQPGSGPVKVRVVMSSDSNSQGFKTTGVKATPAAVSTGQAVYTNDLRQGFTDSPGLVFKRGQRLTNTDGIVFAQTSPDTLVTWNGGQATVNVVAVTPGVAGNVGDHTITSINNCCGPFDSSRVHVTNPQATGGGVDPASSPVMTESDFDAGRAVLEQELRQSIAQRLQAAIKPGEKLSETLVYSAPQYNTDHQPGDLVPSFSGTMTLQGEGDYYVDADVKKAFQQYLTKLVPNDQQLLEESPIQVTYRILSAAKGGNLTFIGDANAFVAPKLDENAIRAHIVGRPVTSAKLYMQSLPIRSVTIRESPIGLPLMPLLAGRISLHYVVQQDAGTGQGQPTASPSPSSAPSASP